MAFALPVSPKLPGPPTPILVKHPKQAFTCHGKWLWLLPFVSLRSWNQPIWNEQIWYKQLSFVFLPPPKWGRTWWHAFKKLDSKKVWAAVHNKIFVAHTAVVWSIFIWGWYCHTWFRDINFIMRIFLPVQFVTKIHPWWSFEVTCSNFFKGGGKLDLTIRKVRSWAELPERKTLFCLCWFISTTSSWWFQVSTQLKNMSQIGPFQLFWFISIWVNRSSLMICSSWCKSRQKNPSIEPGCPQDNGAHDFSNDTAAICLI